MQIHVFIGLRALTVDLSQFPYDAFVLLSQIEPLLLEDIGGLIALRLINSIITAVVDRVV